jgi:hypothetical protein
MENPMQQERKELFSVKVKADRRTYFFDIKETRDGARYLSISEVDARKQRNRIMVFDENAEEFQEGLQKALDFLAKKRPKV